MRIYVDFDDCLCETARLIEADCTPGDLKTSNRWYIDTFGGRETVVLIEDDYDTALTNLQSNGNMEERE